jgi:hypothetical protein
MSDTAPNTAACETDTSLVLRKNPSHNVLVHIEEAKNRLARLATLYLVAEAAGNSQATLDAKRRDLQRFLCFYQKLYKHDRPEEWFVSVTKAFLKALQREKRAAGLARAHLRVRKALRPLAAPKIPRPLSPRLPYGEGEAACAKASFPKETR